MSHPRLAGARQARIRDLGFRLDERETTEVEGCNLCGATAFTVLSDRDRYGFPARTVACLRCGLAMINPRMTPREYGQFYESVYRRLVTAYYGRRIDAKTIQAGQLAYAKDLARVVSPWLAGVAGRRLLDVGGSTGVVAGHLATEFGLQPTVLDPAPEELVEAAASGLETIAARAEDWEPGEARYDVIGMFQTIDHLLDVRRVLATLRRVIADDGVFLVDIVDFRAACRRQGALQAATKVDHPFSLTEATTAAFLARAGFTIVDRVPDPSGHLLLFICMPGMPVPDALPSPQAIGEFFAEVSSLRALPRPREQA